MKKFGLVILIIVFFLPLFSRADSCVPIWPDTTCSVSDGVNVSAVVLGGGGGNGGQSGSTPIGYHAPASISFSGTAYPFAHMYVLKDGQNFLSTNANSNSSFYTIFSGINPGVYSFSVFVESNTGVKYKIGSWTVEIKNGMKVEITGITIPQNIWDLLFSIKIPELIPKPYICSNVPADFNCDRSVDLSDLSILTYFYRVKEFFPKYDINKDKEIELGDFSVLAYYWTG